MENDVARVKAEVDALLVRHGLATVEANVGLICIDYPTIQHFLTGEQVYQRGYLVYSAAHRLVYQVVDQYSLPHLFAAFDVDGETQLANFVLPKVPAYRRLNDVWRETSKRLGRPPRTLAEVEPIFTCLVRCMSRELSGMKVADTPRNRVKLLNLHMAYAAHRLAEDKRSKSAWSHELLGWLDADVDIEYILCAFDRAAGRKRQEARKQAPLAELAGLHGVPLVHVKMLYPELA